MRLTGNLEQTLFERLQRDPVFAQTLFDEALTLMFMGEPQAARVILRSLIRATLGFEALAERIGRPAKGLRRMFSPRGSPKMRDLASVVDSRHWLSLSVHVRSSRIAPKRLATEPWARRDA